MKNSCLIVIMLAALGCSRALPPEAEQEDRKPVVYTTFYPTTYFAERIGGSLIEVRCPVPADADPIFWMPPPDVLEAYQKADLVVLNGAGFEQWVEKVSLPPSRTVSTSEPFKEDWVTYKKAVKHSHGPTGEHAHEGLDGHTWLDPNLAVKQAKALHKALVKMMPESKNRLDQNMAALEEDLEELDQSLQEVTELLGEQHLLASHPAYNYIKQRYRWKISSLDLDPEQVPDEKTTAYIKSLLEGWPACLLLWESPPSTEVAAHYLEVFKLDSVVFSPFEQPPETDYLAGMKHHIQTLKGRIQLCLE